MDKELGQKCVHADRGREQRGEKQKERRYRGFRGFKRKLGHRVINHHKSGTKDRDESG